MKAKEQRKRKREEVKEVKKNNFNSWIFVLGIILVIAVAFVMIRAPLKVGADSQIEKQGSQQIGDISNNSAVMVDGSQEINMEVTAEGWSPTVFVLKKGVPVVWKINAKKLTYCNSEVIVPGYGLDIDLEEGENIIKFTPGKEGNVEWTCGMGMLHGTFVVTEDGKASSTEISAAAPKASSGGCGCGGRK
jgi:uncharacterized protein